MRKSLQRLPIFLKLSSRKVRWEQNSRTTYSFGPFLLDPTEHLLFSQDQHIPLTPKAFDTLIILVERSGRLVTKEELLQQVWLNAFVEEATLAKNIFTVRKALGGLDEVRKTCVWWSGRTGFYLSQRSDEVFVQTTDY
jgi:DNA-binding winged helix-turn-helix (wHTH) protein